MSRPNPTELVRAAWGAALLLAPRPVLRHVHGAPLTGPGVPVLRVLGARHLLQAAAVTVWPSHRVLLVAAAVDLSHCVSMVPLALYGGRYARAGAVETAVAGAWALVETRRALSRPC
jgi:hypothetical protein